MAKGTLQRLTIIGRLGTAPEIKEANGKMIARLNIATTDRVKSKDSDEYEDITTWLRISLFDKNAEFCRNYLHQGDSVHVEARLRNAKWENKEGVEQHSLDIIGYQVQQVGKRASSDDKHHEKPQRDKKLADVD